MNLSEEEFASCLKEIGKRAYKDVTLQSVQNLMETTGWSMEETMRKLEIPEEEWGEYKKMMREEILKI